MSQASASIIFILTALLLASSSKSACRSLSSFGPFLNAPYVNRDLEALVCTRFHRGTQLRLDRDRLDGSGQKLRFDCYYSKGSGYGAMYLSSFSPLEAVLPEPHASETWLAQDSAKVFFLTAEVKNAWLQGSPLSTITAACSPSTANHLPILTNLSIPLILRVQRPIPSPPP